MAADAKLGDLFLATPTEHWSAAAVMAGVVAWEAALRELGVGSGDRVGVLLSSGATAVMQLLALTKIGAIAVIPSRRWHQTEQKERCRLHGATAIIDAGTPSPPPLVTADSLWGWGDRLADNVVQGIYFTSGTSGTPKPVPLTVGNHRASAIAIHRHMEIRTDDYWLNCLPLYHIGGQSIVWRCLFWHIPFYLLPFVPESVHHAVAEHPITHISLVPTMLWRLRPLIERSPEPWQRLRGIVIGGAPLGTELRRWAQRWHLPLCPTYGMTETASQMTTLLPWEMAEKPDSVGRALPHVTLCLQPDGELWVRGAMVSPFVVHASGWLATGDHADCDADGYWYLRGRIAETINCGGEKINPQELEDLLTQHPDVEDACAIARSDPEWGQVVGMVVVTTSGVGLSLDAVQEFLLAQNLPRYKLPRHLWHWTALPRTANGKLQRQQVAQRIVTNSSALEG